MGRAVKDNNHFRKIQVMWKTNEGQGSVRERCEFTIVDTCEGQSTREVATILNMRS